MPLMIPMLRSGAGHRGWSRLTVAHMLSNQAWAWATYWPPTIRVVSLLVVEHGGVLAHQVIHRHALAVQRHGVLGDRVEAEERLGPVQDVQLEHRRRAVHPDLRRRRLHQAQVGQLGHRLGDCLGMAAGDLLGSLPERGLVGQVADPARDGPRLAGVRDQDPDVDALGHELARAGSCPAAPG